MNVYFISGLGADKRVFSQLRIDSRFTVHHIEWISPERNETLSQYAHRLAAQVDTTQPFQLVGLSFGGVMASELADIIHPDQIIIISSTPVGIPVSAFYRGLLHFLLLSPFSAPILKSSNRMTYKYFGANTPELKALLKTILHDTDSHFLKWALKRMSSWERRQKVPGVFHIHGTSDRLIAPRLVQPDVWIEDGGHLMIYDEAAEISGILNRQLSTRLH
ncbi:alpha/beta fold hydrolase [Dyadobacter sandarakinus]|uniref:Alpha/beta hydrolase n=1 Tax=Dyadobacter sandarakinus TaxID=2747268 RepID=A0ABX7IBV0_9BACT|nr:alpha/beta hydrolase [Dyadobacter sandarakinus]QRR03295.1 alpha/beta hydrolase [Dyadobacter sandarakinus]